VRQPSRFLDHVCPDGTTAYPAAAGCYVLYVSYACPWAHRAIIVRRLKRLEDVMPMAVVNPYRDERGWGFGEPVGSAAEPFEGFRFLAEASAPADPDCTGRVTVPTLWDTATRIIVCNESALIMRTLDRAFDAFTDVRLDLRPPALVEALAEEIYEDVNNGVYRCGFAAIQAAYDEAVGRLFARLDLLDRRLADRRYLMGPAITEVDWRLFTTPVRFDPRLRRVLQDEPAPDRRPPEPRALPARPVPAPRHRRDRPPRPGQAALLRHAPAAEPERDLPRRARARLGCPART